VEAKRMFQGLTNNSTVSEDFDDDIDTNVSIDIDPPSLDDLMDLTLLSDGNASGLKLDDAKVGKVVKYTKVQESKVNVTTNNSSNTNINKESNSNNNSNNIIINNNNNNSSTSRSRREMTLDAKTCIFVAGDVRFYNGAKQVYDGKIR
jgi:hypothetical protein